MAENVAETWEELEDSVSVRFYPLFILFIWDNRA